MKKLLAAAFCVLIGFVLGVVFLSAALHVGAVSPATATENGDTNGDGAIDISDAVHLLNYLFVGGADVAEIKCPEVTFQSRVVATGQTECVGESSIIDCNVPKARGQDGQLRLGCPVEGRFADNGDGTVSDLCTGLMWTKGHVDVDNDGEIVRGDGFMNPSQDEKTWLEACQIAVDMRYLGHDDWRVPNVQELFSILNWGEASGELAPIFRSFNFDTIDGKGTWSSTHYAHNSSYAFGVGLAARRAACDCCVVRWLEASEYHLFVAVRGPVSTP